MLVKPALCVWMVVASLFLGPVAWAAPPTPTATPVVMTSAKALNLRAGPGTGYAVAGAVKVGDRLSVVGRNAAGDWLRLSTGAWVYGPLLGMSLATPAATRLPVLTVPALVKATAAPLARAVVAATATPAAVRSSSACAGGCTAQPDPSCEIKGNVNSKGEKIYHTRASHSYNVTKVKTEEGDRWFCTEAEAQAAGFRAPLN